MSSGKLDHPLPNPHVESDALAHFMRTRLDAMGSKLPPLDEELYRRTDEVLHYIWDPIGVSTAPEARDEYHSYLPQVFGLLKASADAEHIAAHLTEIATKRMGLFANRKHDLEVAELLLYWQRVINEKGV